MNRINFLMFSSALPLWTGCATDLGSADVRQVTGQASALYLNCSSELETFIANNQVAAGIATTMAYNNFDPNSSSAVKYFGAQYDPDHVSRVLKQTLNIAYSNEVIWSCDPAGPDVGTNCANADTIFYTKDNAADTGDWTIHVCGDRILQLQGSVDGQTSASPAGALVHEISHLAGTWCDGQYGEAVVLQRAQVNDPFSPFWAEAYRYYVMNWDQD